VVCVCVVCVCVCGVCVCVCVVCVCVCGIVIVKPQYRGGPATLGTLSPWK